MSKKLPSQAKNFTYFSKEKNNKFYTNQDNKYQPAIGMGC